MPLPAQVQRIGLHSFMQRDWSNTRLLEQVPAPFVLQVLLPALLREYSHKPAAATATGRVEGSTADPSACASTRTSHQLRCSYSYSYNSLAAATASWWGSEAGCCPNQCSRCCYSQLVGFRGWLLPQPVQQVLLQPAGGVQRLAAAPVQQVLLQPPRGFCVA